mmetsp:Transcript_31056/g.85040  ORF Transcript_31056/g.85040 Transcript_31056/m.85040 type:complete len:288 (+) Transcript_31056:134-997(+)
MSSSFRPLIFRPSSRKSALNSTTVFRCNSMAVAMMTGAGADAVTSSSAASKTSSSFSATAVGTDATPRAPFRRLAFPRVPTTAAAPRMLRRAAAPPPSPSFGKRQPRKNSMSLGSGSLLARMSPATLQNFRARPKAALAVAAALVPLLAPSAGGGSRNVAKACHVNDSRISRRRPITSSLVLVCSPSTVSQSSSWIPTGFSVRFVCAAPTTPLSRTRRPPKIATCQFSKRVVPCMKPRPPLTCISLYNHHEDAPLSSSPYLPWSRPSLSTLFTELGETRAGVKFCVV